MTRTIRAFARQILCFCAAGVPAWLHATATFTGPSSAWTDQKYSVSLRTDAPGATIMKDGVYFASNSYECGGETFDSFAHVADFWGHAGDQNSGTFEEAHLYVNVQQNDPPVPTLTGPTQLAVNQVGTWDFSASDANSNLKQWRFRAADNPDAGWTPVGGGSVHANPPYSRSWSAPGNYTWVMEVYDLAGAFSSISLNVEVGAASQPVSTTFSFAGRTYNGFVQAPIIAPNPAGANYTSSGTLSAIDAGTYPVSATAYNGYTGTTNGTWTIAKAGQVASSYNATGSVGVAFTPSFNGGSGAGGWEWKIVGIRDWTTSSWTPTNAGSYTFYVVHRGDLNHNDSNVAGPYTFSVGSLADTQAPTQPGNLTFSSISSTTITINWTASTDNVGVTGYRFYRNGTFVQVVTGLNYTDSNLTPSTSYSYSVVAVDAAGNVSTARTGSASTSANTGGGLPTLRINAGGSQYTDSAGHVWSADSGYNTGSVKSYDSGVTVNGTSDQTLFRSERYDAADSPELAYTFAVPNGSYVVRLYLAETYGATSGAGLRVFDIDIQGSRAFEDLDIYAETGGANTLLVKPKMVTVSNGQITIGFVHQVQNPKINAIEILPASTADTQPPTSPGTLTFSGITTSSVGITWAAASDNVGVTSYRVLRNGTVLATTTSTSYTDTGLAEDTIYSYAVAAVDAGGNVSGPSTRSMRTLSSAPSLAVTGLTLIDAATQNALRTLADGSTIDLGQDGSSLNVRADVSGTVGSVVFKLDGVVYRTESTAPYALAGETSGSYNSWTPAVGSHTLQATPYSAANGGGTAGTQVQIAFDVVPAPSDTQAPSAPGTLSFSNVSSGGVTISWGAASDNVGVTGYRISRNGSVLTTVAGLSYDDAGLSSSTSYTYSVAALDAAGNLSSARSAVVTTTSSGGGGSTTIRVNAGGGSYTDPDGHLWSADAGYNTGETYLSSANITGTSTPELFQSERFDRDTAPELTYTFAVPNGAYVVHLLLAENYDDTSGTGLRVFDVSINGQLAFDNVDIYSLAQGAHKALILEKDVNVTDGQIVIGFAHQTQNTKINAIEILPGTSTPPADTQPPTTPGSLTFGNVTASSATLNWTAASDNVGVTGYRVSRGSATLATVTGLSFADSGLSASTSYSYSVVALDAAGNVSPARSGSVTTATNAGPTVTSFTLIDTNAQQALRALADGGTIVLSEDGSALNVRADVNGSVACVVFYLDGVDYREENAAPFALGGDHSGNFDSWTPSVGSHTLKAVPYSATNRGGAAGTPYEIAFEVTASPPQNDTQPPSAPGALAPSNITSSSVTLAWSAASDNVGVTGYRISRNGVAVSTVSGLNYTDAGLTSATTYDYAVVALDAAGNASPASTATISTASGGSSAAVTSLTLIDASAQSDLRTLANGSSVNLSVDGSSLNVRANVSGSPGSVAFVLDGAAYRTENTAPYALEGDSSGVYNAWTPAAGSHTLKAIPYSGANKSGTAGTALQVTFSVQQGGTADLDPDEDEDGDGVSNGLEAALGLNPMDATDVQVRHFEYDKVNQLEKGPGGTYIKDSEGNIKDVQPE